MSIRVRCGGGGVGGEGGSGDSVRSRRQQGVWKGHRGHDRGRPGPTGAVPATVQTRQRLPPLTPRPPLQFCGSLRVARAWQWRPRAAVLLHSRPFSTIAAARLGCGAGAEQARSSLLFRRLLTLLSSSRSQDRRLLSSRSAVEWQHPRTLAARKHSVDASREARKREAAGAREQDNTPRLLRVSRKP
jgi:hypothetical protein